MVDGACSSTRKKVLVISSSDADQSRLSGWLIGAGYQTACYSDGRKIVEIAEEEHPDLVVLDLDGVNDSYRGRVGGLCAEHQVGVPVLVLTEGSEGIGGAGESCWDIDCIRQPSVSEDLLTRVRAMLRVASDSGDEASFRKRDGLTKVYNRRYFDERLEMEIERARRYGRKVSCVMVDIDGFKEVNQRHGHKVGDEILKVLADILLANTRSSDIVSRYGGEEFVVILPETAGEHAAIQSERVRRKFEERALCAEEGRCVTVSCGVAEYPDHAADAPTLLRMADSAVFRAKEKGGNVSIAAFNEVEDGFESETSLATRILLVEDNDYNRCVASLVLRASGYEVLEAVDGQMGISLARSTHPDLVLIDLQMKDANGLETTKQIVELDETKGVPIVALTSADVPEQLEALARVGCRGYIVTPIDTNILASQVQVYLDE